jgi:heme-degrading monooxygenase HmoA
MTILVGGLSSSWIGCAKPPAPARYHNVYWWECTAHQPPIKSRQWDDATDPDAWRHCDEDAAAHDRAQHSGTVTAKAHAEHLLINLQP